MNESIRNLLITLAILQRTDSAREALEKSLAIVDQRIDELEDQLKSFEHRVEEGQVQLDTLKKQYRSDEGEIKAIETAVTKSDDKLRYVKTNKEYQSMLKEIDELKIKKATIEDRMIETLEQIEEAEKQVASLKADLADMKGEVQEQQGTIRQEAQAQHKELASLDQEREEIWSELDPKMRMMYTRAKQQGHGIAVAAVIDAVCQECRMNIPPQAFIDLMRVDSMSMCPHCQRIIYPNTIIEGEPM